MTDGYLNELKYFEQLSNPLGGLEAVAYGNWDLVKETVRVDRYILYFMCLL